MDELQDVYDDRGIPTGEQKTKAQIFADGDWRLVTHAWIVDEQENMLVQRRVVDKGIFDNLWDVSMGGGIGAGENSRAACIREIDEELGLEVTAEELFYVGRFKIPKFIPERQQHTLEFSDTFFIKRTIDLADIKMQPTEVAEVAYKPLSSVVKEASVSGQTLWVPHGSDYYTGVEKIIRAKYL